MHHITARAEVPTLLLVRAAVQPVDMQPPQELVLHALPENSRVHQRPHLARIALPANIQRAVHHRVPTALLANFRARGRPLAEIVPPASIRRAVHQRVVIALLANTQVLRLPHVQTALPAGIRALGLHPAPIALPDVMRMVVTAPARSAQPGDIPVHLHPHAPLVQPVSIPQLLVQHLRLRVMSVPFVLPGGRNPPRVRSAKTRFV